MRRIVIEVSDATFDKLTRAATEERRATRDQAAVVIERALGDRQVPDRYLTPPADRSGVAS